MLTTTDVPLLVVQLMVQRPWIRRRRLLAKPGGRQGGIAAGEEDDDDDDDDDDSHEVYDNGQWRVCRADVLDSVDELHPVAAHLWLLLLSLVFHPAAPRKYDLTDYRCQQLVKVRPF